MSTLSIRVPDQSDPRLRLKERYLALRGRLLHFGWGVVFVLGVLLALLDPYS